MAAMLDYGGCRSELVVLVGDATLDFYKIVSSIIDINSPRNDRIQASDWLNAASVSFGFSQSLQDWQCFSRSMQLTNNSLSYL
jgi:hypothetical protein